MRAGAADFMTKPFLMDDFLKRIETHRRPGAHGGSEAGYILGTSARIRDAEDLLRRYAGHDLPVFITGETGSGKEVAARLLHGLSQRASAPFMAVNCAAIPADLLESEIFGHEKGAFTGAQQRHLGYAERAGSGTLFLDEIGDMPPALQAKLLRLIESGSFFRLGGEKPVPFRARIVAATHRKFTARRRRAVIREDLYYRLAVLPVEIPPLRERSEDVAWLMDRFLADASTRMASRVRGFSALAEEAALGHAWPGNVRELRNRVERAAAICAGEWIMPGDLFPERGVKRLRIRLRASGGCPRRRRAPPDRARPGGNRRPDRQGRRPPVDLAHHPVGEDDTLRTGRTAAFGVLNLRRRSMFGFPNVMRPFAHLRPLKTWVCGSTGNWHGRCYSFLMRSRDHGRKSCHDATNWWTSAGVSS
jgi:DNA-binding NtrC family response regulator